MSLIRKGFKYLRLRFLFLLGKLRGLYSPGQYAIKAGYIHRNKSVYFDDRNLKDEYQNEVYELARLYAERNRCRQILDIGCGSAYKLLKYFSDYETTGVDVEETYNFLKKKYPDRIWIKAGDNKSQFQHTDIIICSDVIEHVSNPDELIQFIKGIRFKLLFLSTPERDMIRGRVDYGPPENKAHMREWNSSELHKYLSRYFEIISQQITNIEQATQLIICRPKA
jgi:SAM-dependent methyltransferase